MKITEKGRYKLTEHFTTRGSREIAHFPAGSILTIDQIDADGRKVIGPGFLDWASDEIPCVPISQPEEL